MTQPVSPDTPSAPTRSDLQLPCYLDQLYSFSSRSLTTSSCRNTSRRAVQSPFLPFSPGGWPALARDSPTGASGRTLFGSEFP